MNAETLASFVVLGRVVDRPTDVCAAWIDSADRTCGKPAAEPWLCRRHVTVATKRADAAGQTVRGDGREVGYGDMGGASRFFFVASHDKGDTSAFDWQRR